MVCSLLDLYPRQPSVKNSVKKVKKTRSRYPSRFLESVLLSGEKKFNFEIRLRYSDDGSLQTPSIKVGYMPPQQPTMSFHEVGKSSPLYLGMLDACSGKPRSSVFKMDNAQKGLDYYLAREYQKGYDHAQSLLRIYTTEQN